MEFQSYSQWQIYDPSGRRKYASAQERRRFLVAADREEAHIRALAHLLAHSGCRISEALALTPEHVDMAAATVTFKTLKRRRPSYRTVPIPRELAAILSALATPPASPIWSMHRATAWRHVKRLFREIRVDGPMACCRGLRHGFGINAATHNVLPNLIQKWMGHALASTTAIYLDAVGEEERRFAERMW